MSTLDNIPYLGSGLGFRTALKQEIIEARDAIDFLEIISDSFIGKRAYRERETLEEICDLFPVIPHGVGLSIGSADGVDNAYLQQIKDVSEITDSPYYSEHLCQTRAPGIDIGHLSPLWFSEETLQCTIRNVHTVQDTLGKPLILENITYLFEIPKAEMSQVDFFNRLVEATGCGVLLDITNVFVNVLNHGYDAIEFLEAMPLESLVQVHLAGGFWDRDIFVDSHTETVQEESWGLLDELLKRTSVKGVILEHDGDFPDDFCVLTDQVSRARAFMKQRYEGTA